MALKKRLTPQRRRGLRLQELKRTDPRTPIEVLAKRFNVKPNTIRSDLIKLKLITVRVQKPPSVHRQFSREALNRRREHVRVLSQKLKDEDIAKILKISAATVQRDREYLGIKKGPGGKPR